MISVAKTGREAPVQTHSRPRLRSRQPWSPAVEAHSPTSPLPDQSDWPQNAPRQAGARALRLPGLCRARHQPANLPASRHRQAGAGAAQVAADIPPWRAGRCGTAAWRAPTRGGSGEGRLCGAADVWRARHRRGGRSSRPIGVGPGGCGGRRTANAGTEVGGGVARRDLDRAGFASAVGRRRPWVRRVATRGAGVLGQHYPSPNALFYHHLRLLSPAGLRSWRRPR